MYLEIYIDMLFLINLIFDFILLRILKKVRKQNSTTIRLILGSVIGAINACLISLMPNLNGIIKFLIIYVLTSYIMVRIAFRFSNRRERMKNIVMLFIITFFLGGFLNSIYYHTNLGYYFRELLHGELIPDNNLKYFLLISPLCYIVVKMFVRAYEEAKGNTQIIYEVKLRFEKISFYVKGLYDTGNSLREPISNKPVSIAEYDSIKFLLPKNLQEVIESFLKDGDMGKTILSTTLASSIRFIPFQSIGKEKGMLIGVVFKEAILYSSQDVDKKNQGENLNHIISSNDKVIIAMHKGKLSNKDNYQIILHKELL